MPMRSARVTAPRSHDLVRWARIAVGPGRHRAYRMCFRVMYLTFSLSEKQEKQPEYGLHRYNLMVLKMWLYHRSSIREAQEFQHL